MFVYVNGPSAIPTHDHLSRLPFVPYSLNTVGHEALKLNVPLFNISSLAFNAPLHIATYERVMSLGNSPTFPIHYPYDHTHNQNEQPLLLFIRFCQFLYKSLWDTKSSKPSSILIYVSLFVCRLSLCVPMTTSNVDWIWQLMLFNDIVIHL